MGSLLGNGPRHTVSSQLAMLMEGSSGADDPKQQII
jgi:hypothetical protein